ncbi:MAG: hypothetical protein ACK5Y6_09795, partial [Pseudomonadota bacterium]
MNKIPPSELLERVQALEQRNRTLAFSARASAVLGLAVAFVTAELCGHPRWISASLLVCGVPALLWGWRPGSKSLRVSRLEAAELVDHALDSKARAVSYESIKLSGANSDQIQGDLIKRQLQGLIPAGVDIKNIAPFKLTKSENRSLAIAALLALVTIALIAFRPLTPIERLMETIAEIESEHQQLPQEARQVIEGLKQTVADPGLGQGELSSALADARSALSEAKRSIAGDSKTASGVRDISLDRQQIQSGLKENQLKDSVTKREPNSGTSDQRQDSAQGEEQDARQEAKQRAGQNNSNSASDAQREQQQGAGQQANQSAKGAGSGSESASAGKPDSGSNQGGAQEKQSERDSGGEQPEQGESGSGNNEQASSEQSQRQKQGGSGEQHDQKQHHQPGDQGHQERGHGLGSQASGHSDGQS